MSDVLRVRRLQVTYQLAPSAAGERARLDRIMDELLADALGEAAAAAGLEERDEICIRCVESAVRVPGRASDGEVARAWAESLVDAVARRLSSAEVVHFRSRRHALLDLVASVSRGDTTRAWAWRQLGLLWGDRRTIAGDRDVAMRVTAALRSEPEALVAVLVALAREGDALPRVARLLTADEWQALAATALAAAGATPEHVLEGADTLRGAGHERALSERIAARSEIVRALRHDVAAAFEQQAVARAVAALALVEVEPALAYASTARAAAVVDELAARIAASVDPERVADSPRHDPDTSAVPAVHDESAGGRHTEASGDPSPTPEITWPEQLAVDDDAPAVGLEPQDEAGVAPAGVGRPADRPRADRAPAQPVDAQRDRAWTRAGGLLFLLNVLHDRELGDELAADEALAVRPFRWSLHRLALQLAPVGADDPAALAFAGLPPDEDPPSLGEPPPTDEELERILDYADRIVDDLRERLGREEPRLEAPAAEPPPGRDIRPTAAAGALALLDFVCRRPAEIVADPGWIEARFSAEEADAELRRAALDLDPGWLPWLGAVVVFAYD